MTLARLVAAWGKALKGAIRRCGPDGLLITDENEPPLVAATAAEALDVAGDLAALIDDMRLEGIGFERLQPLVANPLDAYLARRPQVPQDRLRGVAGVARREGPGRPGRTGAARGGARDRGDGPRPARADDRRRLDRRQRRHRQADRRGGAGG